VHVLHAPAPALQRLPLGAPSAKLQPLEGWRLCVHDMHGPNGLNDAPLASPRAPA